MTEQKFFYGLGRRKSAVSMVRLIPGTGKITVNNKPVEVLFPREYYQQAIREPLKLAGMADKLDAVVKINGGGLTGQAEAIRYSIARALVAMDEKLKTILRQGRLLTRDPRVKERKKYGLRRARKAPQYTKR